MVSTLADTLQMAINACCLSQFAPSLSMTLYLIGADCFSEAHNQEASAAEDNQILEMCIISVSRGVPPPIPQQGKTVLDEQINPCSVIYLFFLFCFCCWELIPIKMPPECLQPELRYDTTP